MIQLRSTNTEYIERYLLKKEENYIEKMSRSKNSKEFDETHAEYKEWADNFTKYLQKPGLEDEGISRISLLPKLTSIKHNVRILKSKRN